MFHIYQDLDLIINLNETMPGKEYFERDHEIDHDSNLLYFGKRYKKSVTYRGGREGRTHYRQLPKYRTSYD